MDFFRFSYRTQLQLCHLRAVMRKTHKIVKSQIPEILSQYNSPLSPTIVLKIIRPKRKPKHLVVRMSEPLPFNGKESEVSIKTKPIYKVPLTYGVTDKTMCTAVNLLDTEADVNPMHTSFTRTVLKNGIRRHDLSRLHTTTRKFLELDEFVLFHLRLGDSCTRDWICIAPHIPVDTLLGTSCIDRFIRKISYLKE